MTDNIYVGWKEMYNICLLMALQIGERNYKKIVGVSRGGLVPGVILSHALDIPFEPLQWQTRDGNKKDTLSVALKSTEDPNDILFVDDICDSGLTIGSIRNIFPESQWAVLYSKKGNMGIDFEGERLYNNKQWIVFPWEKK
jgi:hypothetical protein